MASVNTEAILERRQFFPRGLQQPSNGYRFSLDSLLLACFATPGRNHVGIDLGCGCGVVGLALLLRHPGLSLVGLEQNPESVDAARYNAVNLHYSEKLTIVQGDVKTWRPERVVDFVVANPPFREEGRGRTSQGEGRASARFEQQGGFADFARCAAIALKTRGKFTFVHLPERLPELFAGLAAAGLAPKRMRLVHGREDEVAKMVLMETVKAGGPGLKVEPPLVLHRGRGRDTVLTEEALEYCPFLACNCRSE